MITEIYIDNFRCFTNFRIKPGGFQLWLGDNGSGKTSVMDALRCLQRLVRGEHVADIFQRNSLTTWDLRREQTFGLSWVIDGETYQYTVTVEHADREDKRRIKEEKLFWKNSPFYWFDGQEAKLYRIDPKNQAPEEGTAFPAKWDRSMIPTIGPREDNTPLIQFRNALDNLLIIHPVPITIGDIAASESQALSKHAENFAQWYRHRLQENPNIVYRAKQLLEDVLPGFEQLSLKESGDSRRLTATFRIQETDRVFNFKDISDG